MSPAESEAARRNITIPPKLWREVVMAAARETARTGDQVSASAWIRQAIKDRLSASKSAK